MGKFLKHGFKLGAREVATHYLEHKTEHNTNPLRGAFFTANSIYSGAEMGGLAASAIGWGGGSATFSAITAASGPVAIGLGAAWGISEVISWRNRAAEQHWRRTREYPGGSRYVGIQPNFSRSERNRYERVTSIPSSHSAQSSFLKSQFKSLSSIGYPQGHTSKEFRDVIRATGLVNSYNSIHPESRIEHAGGRGGEIGGVASQVGRIEGLKDSATEVLFDEHIFCLPTPDGKPLFSDAQLKQILRELSIGIFANQAYPFFSLHFNNDAAMYPVLHPIYQNTLIGEVIGMLDYFMKGFLNGGIFDKTFLKDWPKTQNTNPEFLKSHLIDLKKLFKQHKQSYTSLREKMAKVGLELPPGAQMDENRASVFNNKFRTSFRIIAKQKNIFKHENMFLIDSDFDVFYTIDVMPEYQEYLDQYYRANGKYPQDYLTLRHLYEEECEAIKEQMPKLPLFNEYFQMLGVINFFCYYLTTLKDMGKRPQLLDLPLSEVAPFPKVMPPIPVRYYTYHPVKLTIGDVLMGLTKEDEMLVNQYLKEGVNTPFKILPEKIKVIFGGVLRNLLSKQMPVEVINHEDFNDNIETLQTVLAYFFKGSLLNIKQEWHEYFKDIINKFGLDINLETFDAMKTMQEKFTVLFAAPQKNRDEDIKQLSAAIAQQKQTAINEQYIKIDEQRPEAILAENKEIDAEAAKVIAQKTQEINQSRNAALNNINAQWGAQHRYVRNIPANISNYHQAINQCNASANAMIANLTQSVNSQTATLKTNTSTRIAARCDEIKRQMEEKVSAFYDEEQKRLITKMTEADESRKKALTHLQTSLEDINTLLKSIPEVSTKTLTEQIQYSTLEIADSGYYQSAGDNHRIVGGCGVSLPNAKQKSIPMGDKMAAAFFPLMQKINQETMVQASYNGKTYSIFKLPTKDLPAYSLLDEDILNVAVKQKLPMTNDELTAISELTYESMTQEAAILPSFKPEASDKLGQTSIHYLAIFGNAKQLDNIIQGNLNYLTLADMHGRLPIHTAAMAGNLEAITYFIGKDAKLIEAQNNNGATALLLAAEAGHTALVEKLLSAGANVNYTLPNGLFALYLAIQNGYEATALALIEKGVGINVNAFLDSGNSALHLAIEMQQTKVALALLAHGADANVKRKTDGYTPFHCACEIGAIDVCKSIVARGKTDVNLPLTSGKTALHLAVSNGHKEMVEWLYTQGKANINAKTIEGETPLFSALRVGEFDTAHYLASESEINIVNKDKQNASTFAAQMGQFAIADQLINRGEILQQNEENTKNYIYYLLVGGQYHRYKTLVEKNTIDPNLSFDGLTSLDIAAMNGHKLLIDFLISKKAQYTLNHAIGWELIHFAVKANHLSFLKQWIKQQNDFNYPVAKGNDKTKTLSFIAAENGGLECLQELLKTSTKKTIKHAFGRQHLLYAAIKSGKKKILDAVLTKCDDANCKIDEDDNTIAHIVTKLGMVKLLKHVKARGIDFLAQNKQGKSAFHVAIQNDDAYTLRKLLKLVSADNWPRDLLAFALENNKMYCFNVLFKQAKLSKLDTTSGIKALNKACQLGQLENIILLLNLGLDLNTSLNDESPLQQAIKFGHVALVNLLLQQGADPYFFVNGQNAFEVAITSSQVPVIRLLQQLGHQDQLSQYAQLLETKKINGDSQSINYVALATKNSFEDFDRDKEALVAALKEVDEEKFKAIVATFPFNHLLFSYDNTELPLLQLALKMEAEWAIKILLDAGADPLCKDVNGFSLYHYLAKCSDKKAQRLIKVLDKHLGQFKDQLLRAETTDGLSVFYLAAINNQTALLETLVASPNYLSHRYQAGNTLLHLAVQAQNEELVKTLLTKGIDVNVVNDQQVTPLMVAAQSGNQKLVQLLLAKGANIESKDIQQNTALHHAIESDKQEIALQIIPLMKKIHCKNIFGNTPFMLAAKQGFLPALSVITSINSATDQVNKKGKNALHLAAIYGKSEAIHYLVQQGFDINASTRCQNPNKTQLQAQLTPLQLAANQGNIATCKVLIGLGADVNQENNFSLNLVEYAIASHSPQAIELLKLLKIQLKPEYLLSAAASDHIGMLTHLLLMGYDIDLQNEFGENALHFACSNRADKAVALLLEQGIELGTIARNGNTALHEAAKSGSVSIIKQLCLHKMELNQGNNQGKTPLHLACENGHNACVLQLLKMGALPNLIDKDNISAAQLAVKNGHLNIAKLLTVFGDRSLFGKSSEKMPAYMNSYLTAYKWELKMIEEVLSEAESKKNNPLHLAIMLNLGDVTRLLCQQHPEYIDQLNNDGETPLHLAVSKGSLHMAKTLVEFHAKPNIKNKNGQTVLHVAFLKSQEDLKTLLESASGVTTAQIMQVKTDIANLYYKKGHDLYQQKKYGLALAEFNRAICFKEDYSKAYYYLGCCFYTHHKDYNKAIAEFDKALKFSPDYAQGYIQKGKCLLSMSEYAKALFCFNEASKLSPTDNSAYYFRAFTYFNMSEWQKAADNITEAIKLLPDNADFIALQNKIEMKLKEQDIQKNTTAKQSQIAPIKLFDPAPSPVITNVPAENNNPQTTLK